MSDYGDHYRDMQHQSFLDRWVPMERCIELGLEPDSRERLYLARALATEAELKKIRSAVNVLLDK